MGEQGASLDNHTGCICLTFLHFKMCPKSWEGKLGQLGASLVKAWPGAAPAQCPLASLSIATSLSPPSPSTPVWRLGPLELWSPCEIEVNCSDWLARHTVNKLTHQGQVTAAASAGGGGGYIGWKNLIETFPTLFTALTPLDELHCVTR